MWLITIFFKANIKNLIWTDSSQSLILMTSGSNMAVLYTKKNMATELISFGWSWIKPFSLDDITLTRSSFHIQRWVCHILLTIVNSFIKSDKAKSQTDIKLFFLQEFNVISSVVFGSTLCRLMFWQIISFSRIHGSIIFDKVLKLQSSSTP